MLGNTSKQLQVIQVDKQTYFFSVAQVTPSATAHRARCDGVTHVLFFSLELCAGPVADHQRVAAMVMKQNSSYCLFAEPTITLSSGFHSYRSPTGKVHKALMSMTKNADAKSELKYF